MIIQLNIDKTLAGTERLSAYLASLISKKLSRVSHQISRVEVHLSDENGSKEGINDKRCLIEARLEGMEPFAVTNHADTQELAVEGAIEKLKTSLETVLERLRKH